MSAAAELDRLLAIMARLRDPKSGCPWDLEQSFRTIVPHTLEEAYEVAEAIETDDMPALVGELGDLMFQVVAARYESGSIVITTNRPFRDWGKIFDVDNTLATAMIDRLMHHGEALLIEGPSYRNPKANDT